MNTIDILYYINLDYRIDRNEQFKSWIEESGFPEEKVERISAIYTPGKGHIGCIQSHIKTLKTFLSSPHKNCIIFEDDFIPLDIPTFWNKFETFFNDKIPYDVVMCSYNQEVITDGPTSYLKKLHHSFTASGYLLTKEFARKLYDEVKDLPNLALEEERQTGKKTHEYTYDVYWCKLMPFNNWYCFYPRIGIQAPSYSDLEQCFTEYNV